MIRAAIIGLGRWGRSLVNAVQGKSGDIQFVAAHTRTRGERRGFLPREKNSAARQLRGHPGGQDDRRRGAGDAAQPACRTGDAGRRRRQAYSCAKAADARSAERQGRSRGGEKCWRHAGGRVQPPLPSFDGGIAQARRRRTARPGDVHGSAAHHQHGTVHPGRTTGGRSPTRRQAAPLPQSACIRSIT